MSRSPDTPERLIATFGRRRGRKLRATKQQAVDTLLPQLGIGDWGLGIGNISPNPQSPIPNPLWLEIGFGSGEHLAHQAELHPEVSIIGCEPYVNGIGNLLTRLAERPLPNLRLFTDDARLLIDALPDGCLDRVFILFPDPWPKSRHHKRRLVQPEFLDALARAMAPGSTLRLATDHADYLAWMLSYLLACPHFSWTARRAADWAAPPADWVRTRYQEKAEAEGRVGTWLEFRKI